MEEVGKIIKTKGKKAEVLIERSAACEHCGACRLISDREMVTEVDNIVGAKEGQLVKISLEDKKVLEASFIVYVIPLLFFIGGYFAGNILANILLGGSSSEIAGIISAFIFLAVSFLLIGKFFGKRTAGEKKFIPVIKEVVATEEGKE